MNQIEKIEKPWGYEVIWAKTDKYVGKFLYINPHSRLSLQYHNKKEETIYVMNGELKLIIEYPVEGKIESTKLPGSIVHIAPGTIHRFGAGVMPVMLQEISTPELDDVVRLEDDYKRD
jgi:mannose-6-phosphate isomerase-like protein (cupin superfamily)